MSHEIFENNFVAIQKTSLNKTEQTCIRWNVYFEVDCNINVRIQL